MPKIKNDTTVILRLPAEQKQRIAKVADEKGATVSELLREAIKRMTKTVNLNN